MVEIFGFISCIISIVAMIAYHEVQIERLKKRVAELEKEREK